jgi:hypothetical protein
MVSAAGLLDGENENVHHSDRGIVKPVSLKVTKCVLLLGSFSMDFGYVIHFYAGLAQNEWW